MDPLLQEAMARFADFQETLRGQGLREPDAMNLATCGADGRPTSRIILMRGCDERGFVFYTNSLSRKGRQLAENPFAAICYYEDQLALQVRIEGRVERISDEESDDYWRRRARGSRIGAWASYQSQLLDDRETLERAVAAYEKQFEGVDDVPRPEHWFGYRVVPDRIEFWEGRPARLHERDVYELQGENWVRFRLYP